MVDLIIDHPQTRSVGRTVTKLEFLKVTNPVCRVFGQEKPHIKVIAALNLVDRIHRYHRGGEGNSLRHQQSQRVERGHQLLLVVSNDELTA